MPVAYEDVAHLMRRAGFGAPQSQISSLATLELPQIIDILLDTSRAEPVDMGTEITGTGNDWIRWEKWIQWWIDRAAFTQAPLVEKMVLFWHGHFTSAMEKCTTNAMLDQMALFRAHGLGSFENLAQRVSVSVAMLEYLDNATNTKRYVNENFARELMELFTLGVNEYTQAEVFEVARAWTGHGVSGGAYRFTATKHDTGNKTIFGTTKNWDGPDVVAAICSGVKQQTSARFIAEKLWAYFAYQKPASALVDALAATFIASDMNISALLRAIFMRPEFYSTQAKQGRVRNPAEFAAAALRTTNLRGDRARPEWFMRSLGMYPWEPPNVAGWKLNSYWVNANLVWGKSRFARHLTWMAAEDGMLADVGSTSVPTAVQRTLDAFEITNATASTRAALTSMVQAERDARGWGQRYNLITAAMLTPEFQLA